MIDAQNEVTQAPRDYDNRGAELNKDQEPLAAHEPVSDVPAVDHHAMIRELALSLHNTSPSGAQTVSDKILFHLDAIADPEAYEASQAELKKAEDEREAVRKAERDRVKAEADKAKVA